MSSPLARLPISARLVAGFALAMVVVLTGAGAFVFWRVQYALDHRLDEDLASQSADLRAAARSRPPAAALAVLGAQARDAQLLGADGRVLASGPDRAGRPALLTAAQAQAATRRVVRGERGNLFSDPGGHIRVRAVPVGVTAVASGRPAVAVTAVRLDQRDEALRELLVQLAVANLVALGLASLVGLRLARGALDPVERYRAQAERIARGATGVRLDVPPGPRDEISRLGTTLNAMLTAQEQAAERQQHFVDDASHELRTPISALAAEVELALRRPRSAEELEAALRRIAGDTARLAALTEELLALGAIGGSTPTAAVLDVRPLLDDAADRARGQLIDAPGRAVHVDSPDGLRVLGDPALLARALGNLVDNAVRHGQGSIALTAAANGPGCELVVHDDGPGMPAEFLPHAAERFRRDKTSRSGAGTGLGLSMVEAIASAHHGQLRLCSGRVHHHPTTHGPELTSTICRHPGTGTTATLLLPDDRGPTPAVP